MRAQRVAERLARAPAALRETGADIIALQEVFLPKHRRYLMEALRDTHPFSLAPGPARSVLGSGLMIFSAVPVRAGGFLASPGTGLTERGVLWAELDHPTQSLPRLINVHVRSGPPRRQAAEIGHLLRAAAGSAIIMGDFNCGPDIAAHTYHRVLREGFADAYTAAGMPEAPTWDACNPLNRTGRFRFDPSQRIDHVFVPCRFPAAVARAVIVFRDGIAPLSDHYGVLVELNVLTGR